MAGGPGAGEAAARPADLAVMALQAATLFRLDAAGRLLAVNEGAGPTAPRLWIGRTTVGLIWRARHDLPDALVDRIAALLAAEPPAADLRAPLACDGALRALLAEGGPLGGVWSGPAWWCPPGIAPHRAVATSLLATDASPARETFPWLEDEIAERQPVIAALHDGVAVALCFSSRNGSDAAEAGLETAPASRRRGFGAAAAAGWAAAVRASGRLPLYSTSWDNLASQGVARSLGLVPYGADLSFG